MNDDSKRDLLTLGVAWEREGIRIDPTGVYLQSRPCIFPACQCRYEDTPNGRIRFCELAGAR